MTRTFIPAFLLLASLASCTGSFENPACVDDSSCKDFFAADGGVDTLLEPDTQVDSDEAFTSKSDNSASQGPTIDDKARLEAPLPLPNRSRPLEKMRSNAFRDSAAKKELMSQD